MKPSITRESLSMGREELSCTEPPPCAYHLPVEDNQEFFHAILTNDEVVLNKLLYADPGKALLQGHFVYPASRDTQGLYQVQLPLALAVVAAVAGGSQGGVQGGVQGGAGGGSVRALLAAGVSPLLAVDCDGNNVLHSLAAFLFHQPRAPAPPPPVAAGVAGSSVLEQYALIVASCDEDTVRAMLQHENNLGLRPLEFAAQNGQAHLIHAIMTPARMRNTGIHCHKYYDVTDYEAQQGSRRQFSPVAFLATLDSTHSANVIEFMKQPWFHSWQMAKIKSHIPLLVIWFLLRMSFITAYFVFAADMSGEVSAEANSTVCTTDASNIHPSSKLILGAYLLLYASLSLATHGVEYATYFYRILTKHVMECNLQGRRFGATQASFYRKCIVTLYIIVILKTMEYFTQSSLHAAFLSNAMAVIDPALIPFSILYFIQMLPGLGLFVIPLYYTASILFQFIIVYIILLFPYVAIVQNFINRYSKEGCVEGFGSFTESAYTMFQIMLNLQNPRDINVQHEYILYLGHVLFTFIISITLLNFFIAITCNNITLLSNNLEEVLMAQRLSIVCLLERRWRWMLRPYYEIMNMKCFRTEGDRIYVVETEVCLKYDAKQVVS